MKTPAQLFCLFGLAIALTQPCRGVVAVTWLDDPIVLWTEWNSRYTPLDINGDELTDYVFAAAIGFVGVRSEGENQYLIWPSGGHNIGGDVEPLAEGFEIGPNSGDDSWMEWFGNGEGYDGLIACLSTGTAGRFAGQHAYMGVAFEIADEIHYGWIELIVQSAFAAAYIYGWGYETDPGVPILAGASAIPEPSTTMLMIGGLLTIGCALRRAKERKG